MKAFSSKDLENYVKTESKRTGKTKEVILEETFHDGYVVISESEGTFKVEAAQLFKGDAAKDNMSECRRLRENFGPISDCVDYVKDMILGGGIDVAISKPSDKDQKAKKEKLIEWISLVYQDEYTISLKEILNILVDAALTDGFSAAEIVYGVKPKSNSFFDDYTKPVTSSIMTKQGEKLVKQDVITFEKTEPDWASLDGISRLKIINGAITRLKLNRLNSWEANYWTLDEATSNPQTGVLDEHQIVAQSMRQQLPSTPVTKAAAYFLPWQIFALAVNRRTWDEHGTSIILPALKTAQLLEKIMTAVGEGIHRAGNKKWFIICGTEKRPWSAVHIRNLLSQLKEASEKSWSTIPVPAGFDLKEAGGEVFEAQNAIDCFLRVIAGTMHVPPSVLGVDFKEVKTEVQHFTFKRLQEALKTAVQTQLFRLHIWTTFGQQKGKQGGHKDPQYIPECRIKTEGLLSDIDRLKMDVQILNVANPVRPEAKLEVERDMMKVMGFEVLLPTQEEYKAEMKKLDEEMKKKLEVDAKAKEANSDENTEKSPVAPNGEKFQGPPRPQDEEMLRKRQEAGVSVRKVGSKKGKARDMTRTVEESATEQTPQQVDVNIKVTAESGKQDITIKHEPILVKTEVTTPLDKLIADLAQKQGDLSILQAEHVKKMDLLKTEENERRKAKLLTETEKLNADIKISEKEIELKNAEIENIKKTVEAQIRKTDAETEKLKTEADESKKTHEEKRKAIKRIAQTNESE